MKNKNVEISNIFHFGTIYLIENECHLQFNCAFCDREFEKFNDFVIDSVRHVSDKWEKKSLMLLEKALKERSEDDRLASNADPDPAPDHEDKHLIEEDSFITEVYIREEPFSSDMTMEIERVDFNEFKALKTKDLQEFSIDLNSERGIKDQPLQASVLSSHESFKKNNKSKEFKQDIQENARQTNDLNKLLSKEGKLQRFHNYERCKTLSSCLSKEDEVETDAKDNCSADNGYHLSQKLECSFCKVKTSSLSALKAHKYRYHPSKGVKRLLKVEPNSTCGDDDIDGDILICSFCKKLFPSRYLLNQHTRAYHSEKSRTQRFSCDMCKSIFRDPANLKVHRYRHLGIKPHCCHYCEKSFTTTTERKAHELSHTKLRNYICDICAKGYFTFSLLKIHKRRHDTERIYTCDKCSKFFFTRKQFDIHSTMHKSRK